MKAGFAARRITPPPGTIMMGFSTRDQDHGCEDAHDELYVRAFHIAHEGAEALIMGYDLCFLGRGDADRIKGAIGRHADLPPSRILLNTSHTHVGPRVGTWAYAGYEPPDSLYLRQLDAASVEAALEAMADPREVVIEAGAGTSSVPRSRRLIQPDGSAAWAPNPDGETCNHLPVCLLRTPAGEPVCLLFSISCHPSTAHGWEISADFPGVACRELDAHLGAPVSLFLQGTGGDTKAWVIGEGTEWRAGTWEDVEIAGRRLTDEVKGVLDGGLREAAPDLCCAEVEMHWPLERHVGRAGFEAILNDPDEREIRLLWAQRQIEILDREGTLPDAVPITAHGVRIADGVRMVGIEGEAVAGLGRIILEQYGDGVTFPLGYTDGAQLYLPTEAMLAEGGYEVDSYHEYGWPARFAPGFERHLVEAIRELQARGVR